MVPQATQPWTPAETSSDDLAYGAPTARLILPAGDLDDSDYRSRWEEVRRSGIGGSEVAKILGLNKYQGPRHVFEEKHGRPVPMDAELSEYAEVGLEIEDFIAYMFTKRRSRTREDLGREHAWHPCGEGRAVAAIFRGGPSAELAGRFGLVG
ncbi:YqaJ viral recombinase family protein [Streptomyces sp. NPDC096013]|uniref:YqaJ viral recombinase family protein n=1 Tax=Streptomyces sp. NPDC096013 TaxID=3366069 RepID=UPI00382E8525